MVIAAVAVVTTVTVIGAVVITAMPVTMIPGIIARAEIDPDITGIIPAVPGRVRIIRIGTIIDGGPDTDSYPNMHSRIGLAGKAQHSHQRNNQ
jgi:hypothetical protein